MVVNLLGYLLEREVTVKISIRPNIVHTEW